MYEHVSIFTFECDITSYSSVFILHFITRRLFFSIFKIEFQISFFFELHCITRTYVFSLIEYEIPSRIRCVCSADSFLVPTYCKSTINCPLRIYDVVDIVFYAEFRLHAKRIAVEPITADADLPLLQNQYEHDYRQADLPLKQYCYRRNVRDDPKSPG